MKQFIKFFIALAAMTAPITNAWAQLKSITYLDYDGGTFVSATTPDPAKKITSESNDLSGWYYVEGEVVITNKVDLSGNTHLILCDGAKLTINSENAPGIYAYKTSDINLTIYAQSSGSHAGELIINSSIGVGGSIYVRGNLTINGGTIKITNPSESSIGIYCTGSGLFTMNGGNLTAVAYDGMVVEECVINGGIVTLSGNNYGIHTLYNNFTINGGQVTAQGGFYADYDNINIGWTNASDFIKSKSYNKLPTPIGTKKFYIEGGGTFESGIAIDKESLAGKKLTPQTDASIYNITLASGLSSDNVEIDKSIAFSGERVAITVTPPAGKILTSLTYNDGTYDHDITTKQANDYVFYMPAADVTVNATFAIPVAQIGNVQFPSLAEALAATPISGGANIKIIADIDESSTDYDFSGSTRNININVNGHTVSFRNFTNKYGKLNIIGPGTINFGHFENQGEFLFKDVTVYCKYIDNPGGAGTITFDNAKAVCNSGVSATISLQLYGADQSLVLKNGSDVEIDQRIYVGYNDNFTLDIQDAASILKLRNCVFGYMDKSYVEDEFLQYIRPDQKAGFSTDLANGNPVTLDLRASWGLMLTDNFGGNATVTFYAGGTSEPTGFDVTNPGETIVTANPGDWIVAHIVPDPGYWTDVALLFGIDASGTLARKRAPLLDPFNTVTLLQADTYDSGSGVMKPRNDGAGWYYYQIPAEHTLAEGYYESRIDGDVVRKFDLGYDVSENSDEVNLDGYVVKAKHGLPDNLTAEITLSDLKFDFTTVGVAPTITKIEIKRGSETLITLKDADDIATQLLAPEKFAIIGNNNPVRTNAASAYTWFKQYKNEGDPYVNVVNGSESVLYEITVPLTVDDDSQPKGTAANPWLIKTPADLVMLADCVNVGQYSFNDEVVVQDNDIDMDGVVGFFPIGGSFTPFMGIFSAYGFEIQNLTISPDATPYTSGDFIDPNIGLFGRLNTINGVAAGVTLRNCTINACAVDNANVGGIAGVIDNKAGVVGCTLIGCTVTGGADNHNVGGIVGLTGEDCTVYENSIIDCTVGSKGLNIGGIVGLAAGTDDGACWVHVNRVSGTTEGSMKVIGGDNSIVGAIFGNRETKWVLMNNKYNYNVEVKHGSTALTGYALRGYRKCTWNDSENRYDPGDYADLTGGADDPGNTADVEGAMMEINPVTLSVAAPTGYSTALLIDADPSTPAVDALVAGQTCYKIVGSTPYLASGDVKTLVVASTIERVDDSRTFHADLTALTLNDGSTDTDILSAMAFTMPITAATISCKYEEADWFTIQTNGKDWMSFYHEWTTGGDATASPTPANYTVTDLAGTKIDALTITGISIVNGSVTTGALGNVSFNGMPTLFHCSGGLPEKLKFTPDASASTNVRPSSLFNGTTEDKDMSGYTNVYVMNASGDFYYADITSTDKTLKAHRCYVALGNTAVVAPARLHISSGDDTAIDAPRMESTADDGRWFTIDGRRLESRPTQKGIYINGGRKVVIK